MRAALVLVALGAAACRVPYRPLVPHAGVIVDGPNQAPPTTVVKLGEEGGAFPVIVVEVKFSGGEVPPLGDAWLAARDSAPCRSGVKATKVRPDAVFAWPDARELLFPRDEAEQSGLMRSVPTVVDIDLLPSLLSGERRCLRLPVTEARYHPEWTAPARWFLGAGLQAVLPLGGAYAGVGDGLLVDFYGGVWAGPLRLRLDWLFGQSGSPRPPPAGYDSVAAVLLGGALSLEVFPVRVGAFGLGVNAGYMWLATEFSASQGGNEWHEPHYGGPRGPRLMLRLGRVPAPPRWPGFANQKDGWMCCGVDVMLARFGGLGGPAATVLGVGVSVDTGYWW